MDEATVAYKLGTLSADVAGLKSDVTDIKTDQKSQLALLQQIAARDAEHRGARRTVKTLAGYIVGSGGGAALLMWLFDHWVTK